MPFRRALMVSAGGVAVVMMQALVVGNQWVVQWIFDHDILEGSGAAEYLRGILLFPHWRLTPVGGFRSLLVPDFGLLLLFVSLSVFTTLGLMALDPVRSAPAALICGWWATFLAASIDAFVAQFLAGVFFDVPAYFDLAVASGLRYALVVGWLPGLAVMAGYLLTRPRSAPGWSPEGPGEPAGASQG